MSARGLFLSGDLSLEGVEELNPLLLPSIAIEDYL